jgi:tryptophan synthase beta chain
MAKTAVLMVNLSGRGDKDMGILARELKIQGVGTREYRADGD